MVGGVCGVGGWMDWSEGGRGKVLCDDGLMRWRHVV